MEAIEVNNLSVTVADKKELTGINLDIAYGSSYMLLGVDGKKRMLMRLIAGGHRGASVYIESPDIIADLALDSNVAFVAECQNVWGWMTAYEYAKYALSTGDWDKTGLKQKITAALSDAGFPDRRIKLCKLSAAQLLLLEIAIRVCMEKDIILANMDNAVYSKRDATQLNQALIKLKAQGKAILISARDARFVGDGVDTVALMSGGALKLQGSPEQLTKLLSTKHYTLKPTGSLAAVAEKIKSIAAQNQVKVQGGKVHVYTNSLQAARQLVQAVALTDEGLEAFRVQNPTLADSLSKLA